MENTNLQNLKELMVHYRPKAFGIVTVEEYFSITSILQLEGMEVTSPDQIHKSGLLKYAKKPERINKSKDSSRIFAHIERRHHSII